MTSPTKFLSQLKKYNAPNDVMKKVFIKAAVSGNLEVFKGVNETWKFDRRVVGEAFTSAMIGGRLDIVKFCLKRLCLMGGIDRFYGFQSACTEVAVRGHLKVLKVLISRLIETMKKDILTSAIINGHLDIIEWLHADSVDTFNVRPPSDGGLHMGNFRNCWAILNGHIHVIKWLAQREIGHIAAEDYTLTIVLTNGHFDTFKWFFIRRSSSSSRTMCNDVVEWFNIISKVGNLGLFKFLYRWYPNVETTVLTTSMNNALRGGHLELVKWIDSLGSPENFHFDISDTLNTLIRNGHLNVLNWIHESNSDVIPRMEMFSSTFLYTIECGRLDILKFLKSVIPLEEFFNERRVLERIGSTGNLEIFKWAIEEHFPVKHHTVFGEAVSRGRVELTKFMLSVFPDVMYMLTKSDILKNAGNGNLEVIKVLYLHYPELFIYETVFEMIRLTASPGRLDFLKWILGTFNVLRESLPESVFCLDDAVCNGHLEYLKWASEFLQRDIHTEENVRMSAHHGNLHVLDHLDFNLSRLEEPPPPPGVRRVRRISQPLVPPFPYIDFDAFVDSWFENYTMTPVGSAEVNLNNVSTYYFEESIPVRLDSKSSVFVNLPSVKSVIDRYCDFFTETMKVAPLPAISRGIVLKNRSMPEKMEMAGLVVPDECSICTFTRWTGTVATHCCNQHICFQCYKTIENIRRVCPFCNNTDLRYDFL